jgi:F0F1-type ATP synthase membrane subunit a
MNIIIDLILWVIMIVIGLEIWMIERALLILFFIWETQHSHGVPKKKQSIITLSTCEDEYVAIT